MYRWFGSRVGPVGEVIGDAAAEIRGDVDRLGEVEAALLGLAPPRPAPPAASARSDGR